jgi:glycosyltransferase involved in cell wall biosynthesis
MPSTLLYLTTEDWFFCSHFLDRAVAAKAAGYDVGVMTHVTAHADAIRARGIRVLPWSLDRGSLDPRREVRALTEVLRALRAERPDILHNIAIKPVVYGALAARLAGVETVVNAPVGMGYVFASHDQRARLLRRPLRAALARLLRPKHGKVIFENSDDLKEAIGFGAIVANDAVLIRGAGIDLDAFAPAPDPEGVPVVTLTARMLWDKGVAEFVGAARRLKQEGVAARFLLVGAPDALNRAAIPQATLDSWQAEGVVECLGFRSDVAAVLAESHVVCLPSYREGLPKSLLEALAAGKPVVTTDVPGCREVVADGINGFLVPARSIAPLADALRKLIADAGLRQRMGAAGRRRAETEFSTQRVTAETLAVYTALKQP